MDPDPARISNLQRGSKVFVSHSSKDKLAVKMLVDALRARGIDAWYDEYEIGPGDDIVAKLNEGLAGRDVGLVIFRAYA